MILLIKFTITLVLVTIILIGGRLFLGEKADIKKMFDEFYREE